MDANLPPFVNKVLNNRSTINIVSIVLLLVAAWACLEIITNLSGSDLIPPETGTLKDANDPDGQRLNDGKVLFVGAVFGTLGVVFQLMIAGLAPEEEDAVVVIEEVDEDIEEAVELDSQDVESDTEEEGVDEELEHSTPEESAEEEAEGEEEEPKEGGGTPPPAGRKF